MADEPTSPRPADEPSRKRQKRSYIACRRCHTLKVKCFGGVPCQRCRNAKETSSCEYPPRGRRVAVSESYLKRLQSDRGLDATPPQRFAAITAESRTSSQGPPGDADISNPLHEPRNLFHLDGASRQQFVGESTCAAFGHRLLQCLHPPSATTSMHAEYSYMRNTAFARQLGNVAACKLPERFRAHLLVRVALRFIGQDYHFFLHHDFLQQLERAYNSKDNRNYDAIWACKFFVVLALGELYSTATPPASHGGSQSVPGTGYFLTAVNLLQDLFEEPSAAQVEIMLLFCFYSNALGRVKSAHMYSGQALRISTCLGIHRNLPAGSILPPVDREHRIRLWWTAYIFDRSTSSRLGQPLSIQDADIDVEMPSETVPAEVQDKFGSPAHLNANIELARITGCIMRDIYGPSSKVSPRGFVQNVRLILKRLRNWDENVAPSLRLSQGGVSRPVASLQLHFNQCIILTTRPILLHVLKVKSPFSISAASAGNTAVQPISDAANTLAESCISAARTSNSILSQLFVENSLATYGYFDAHHLFSSTLVLIVSAIISPNSSDSDAVQTAFQLLKTMRDNGNAAAAQYSSRLAHIQWSVGQLRSRGTATRETDPSNHAPANNDSSTSTPLLDPPLVDTRDFENYDWDDFLVPSNAYASHDWTGVGNVATDPLDNPLIHAFLDHADADWDENLGLTEEEMNCVLS